MATIRKQYYGIKYPFTINNLNGFFVDLNGNLEEKVASEILHVLLTPKGTRIRMPNFGTGLIKYIFEPNDSMSWEHVKSEVMQSVSNFVQNVTLDNIEVSMPEEDEDHGLYLDLRYSVNTDTGIINNRMVVKL